MASKTPLEEHNTSALAAEQDIHEQEPQETDTSIDEAYLPPRPRQTDSTSTENRLRPVADVINRIIWDCKFDSQNYRIIYEDRFSGRLEIDLDSWKKDLTDEEFIPQHRILYIERKSDYEVVWDKRRRIDKVFYSGNSAYSFLEFLS